MKTSEAAGLVIWFALTALVACCSGAVTSAAVEIWSRL